MKEILTINDFLTYRSSNNSNLLIECLATDIPGIVDVDGSVDMDVLSFGNDNSVRYFKKIYVWKTTYP
ncbi:MAG: hypothetical protein R2771_10350 [Saprospiraceae bacterium]